MDGAGTVLQATERRAMRAAAAHYMAADHLGGLNAVATGAGVCAALGVTVLGALPLMFPSVGGQAERWLSAAVLIAGSVLTALTVLQAVGRWGERSAAHRQSAAAYGAAVRELYAIALTERMDVERLNDLFKRLDALAENAVQPPGAIWRRADRLGRGKPSSLPVRAA